MTTGATIAGKYRLLRPLGKGSMGEVWAAAHQSLGREVAIKLIYEGSPELAARLKREALACGRLEHPNIVRVYDFGETDGGDPFLVMELLVGETLADRLVRQQRLPAAEAVAIALDVARALRAAHEAGIVHRDLKPANIFIGQGSEGEHVKVLDFGVSKILTSFDMSVTTDGALVGSPAYMSPEQARALPDIDARADLWSMGVLVFEMLTGTRPFTATTVMSVVTEILAGPIPTLADALPGVDARLDAAVRRCLTRPVDQRMASAATLIDMLTPVLASLRAPGITRATTRARAAVVEELPTVVEDGALSEPTAPLRVRPDEEDEVDSETTVALSPRSRAVDEDDDRATAVMSGHAVLAFRLRNRAAAGQQVPAATQRLPEPSAPAAVPDLGAPPDHEDAPTQVHPRRGPELPDTTAATRMMPLGFGPANPSPTTSSSSAWDNAPTLRRVPAPPPPPSGGTDPARDTITEWDPRRHHNAQTLWMTAVAGLVLMLVLFAGLSLLR